MIAVEYRETSTKWNYYCQTTRELPKWQSYLLILTPDPLLFQRRNGPDAQLPWEVNCCEEAPIWRKAHLEDSILCKNSACMQWAQKSCGWQELAELQWYLASSHGLSHRKQQRTANLTWRPLRHSMWSNAGVLATFLPALWCCSLHSTPDSNVQALEKYSQINYQDFPTL